MRSESTPLIDTCYQQCGVEVFTYIVLVQIVQLVECVSCQLRYYIHYPSMIYIYLFQLYIYDRLLTLYVDLVST